MQVFLSIQLYVYDIGHCMSYPKKYQPSKWQYEQETTTYAKVTWVGQMIENEF